MKSSFCSYPFKHLSIGQNRELRACCVATPFPVEITDVADLATWWKEYEPYKQLRDSHRRGEKPAACNTCWQQEASGWTSMRERVTSSTDTDADLSLRYIEITGGRLCNLSCRMCTSASSNQIERENRPWDHRLKSISQKKSLVNWLDDPAEQEKLLEILCTPTLQSIYFTGGEPQLMPCYQQLLGKWAERRNLGTLAMHLNTNSTVFNEQFWALINRFYHKQIDFSIDATGDAYEHIRFTNYNKVRENMLRIRDYLIEDGKNVFSLTVVGQLANVDQGIELQALYDELASEKRMLASYQFLLMPVTGNPEWQWNTLPKEILISALLKIAGLDGVVIENYRKDLVTALENNHFSPTHAKKVLMKEAYFKNLHGTCLWDTYPDWLEIYQQSI